MQILTVIGGIIGLYVGGEFLVRGAVRFSRVLGIRPIVVGLTVVAFGTSAPELAASIVAALKGAPGVVMGNVIGSNILNIGAILGIVALIHAITTTRSFLRRELPFMIGVCALLLLLVPDGEISRLEGLFLIMLLGVYLVAVYQNRRSEAAAEERRLNKERVAGQVVRSLLEVTVGIAVLVIGARWLVIGAIDIATTLGISERIIGLTVVALGTSLPELASCVVAAAKHESDLILGNLVGSSVFNVLAILGFTALVRPIGVDPVTAIPDILIMTGFAVIAILMLAIGKKMNRWEGGVLLLLFGVYLLYLIG
ncbi:calcium/sodium antiporter [Gemmatimonadota bacterium]